MLINELINGVPPDVLASPERMLIEKNGEDRLHHQAQGKSIDGPAHAWRIRELDLPADLVEHNDGMRRVYG